MPRPARASWHKGAKAWSSAVGEIGENGRRRPVYFYEIPYGPKGSPNDRKAQAALAKYLEARDSRQVRTDEPTFGDLSRAYLIWLGKRVERKLAKPLTYWGHLKALKKFRAMEWAPNRTYKDKVASEMTATELARTVEALATADRGEGVPPGYAPNYIARIVASVQAVLNWAADPLPGREPEKLLAANPVAKFSHEATRAPHSPDRYAEAEEVRGFLTWGYARADRIEGESQGRAESRRARLQEKRGQDLGPRRTPPPPSLAARFERLTMDLIRVSYLTGTRPGELRVAERTDFEPKAVYLETLGQWWGRITLDPSRWKSGSKTRRAREVFLPPEAVGVIEAILALPNHHPRFLWTHRLGKGAAARGATEREHGEPWSDTALPNKICALRRAAIADGVKLQDEGHNRFVLYRLRHTRAADLLMAGVDIATVAKLLGTSVGMVERVYGSFSVSHLAGAASKGLGSAGPST